MTEPEMIRVGQGVPPPTSPPPVKRKRTSLIVGLVAAALVAASGAALGGFFLLRAVRPDTITVTGSITLTDRDLGVRAGYCYGTGGYDDITGGQKVVVKDAAGTVVAIGTLGNGQPIAFRQCRFQFTVTGVPSGGQFYTVEVSHRGALNYTAEDLKAPISLTLGD